MNVSTNIQWRYSSNAFWRIPRMFLLLFDDGCCVCIKWHILDTIAIGFLRCRPGLGAMVARSSMRSWIQFQIEINQVINTFRQLMGSTRDPLTILTTIRECRNLISMWLDGDCRSRWILPIQNTSIWPKCFTLSVRHRLRCLVPAQNGYVYNRGRI